jgi:hypothetical protein
MIQDFDQDIWQLLSSISALTVNRAPVARSRELIYNDKSFIHAFIYLCIYLLIVYFEAGVTLTV